MTAYGRDRDDARDRRAARDADQHRQVIRARLDAALVRREQELYERWRAERDHEDEE